MKYLYLYDFSICNIFHPSDHFLQCQELLRNIVKLVGRKFVFCFFSILFPCCHNTWHRHWCFAEILVAILFQQFSVFLKNLASSTVSFNLFNKLHWTVSQTSVLYTLPQTAVLHITKKSSWTINWIKGFYWILVHQSWQLLNISEKEQAIIKNIFQFLYRKTWK